MSNHTPPSRDHIEGEMRLPLPGLYPVVTWQMNLTLHKATGLAKFTSILREPSDHAELRRKFRELDDWSAVHLAAQSECLDAIGDIGYLLGHPTVLYSR